MNYEVLFRGPDSKKGSYNKQYLINRCGDEMKLCIAQSRKRTKHWSKEKWKQALGDFNQICEDIIRVMNTGLAPENSKAQALIRRHYDWMCRFCTPNRESYRGHSQLILDSELRSAYTIHHPDLPEYVVEAIGHFADNELQ